MCVSVQVNTETSIHVSIHVQVHGWVRVYVDMCEYMPRLENKLSFCFSDIVPLPFLENISPVWNSPRTLCCLTQKPQRSPSLSLSSARTENMCYYALVWFGLLFPCGFWRLMQRKASL